MRGGEAWALSSGQPKAMLIPVGPRLASTNGKGPPAAARGNGHGAGHHSVEHEARVLVVDDHLDARIMLEEYLEQHGFYVAVAKNGAEALALLQGGVSFDAVVLDLLMPDVDGYEFLALLARATLKLRRTPVIVVSAAVGPRVRGVKTVLTKPVNLNRVMDAIRDAVKKRRR